jgi:hypothetical protein
MQTHWRSHRGYPTAEYVTVSLLDPEFNAPAILIFKPKDLPVLREAVALLEQIEREQAAKQAVA